MVHVDNIPYVLKSGFVCRNLSNANYVSIADSVVLKRPDSELEKRLKVRDYIPFYFGPRQPMLYVVQNGYNGVARQSAEDIVYCVVRIDSLISNNVDCVFTDGHALSKITGFYDASQLVNINGILKYADVYSQFWNVDNDIDLKRRKEAELLVRYHLGPDFISGFVVYNEQTLNKLALMGIERRMIAIRPEYYF